MLYNTIVFITTYLVSPSSTCTSKFIRTLFFIWCYIMVGETYSGLETQLAGLWGLMDGIETENYVIAVYIAEAKSKMDALYLVEFLAYEQSTGTWVRVPAETDAVRKKHIAKILGVYELPHYELEIPRDVETRKYCMIVGYPVINMINSANELNWPLLFTNVWGNISLAPNLKMVDLS